MNDNKYGFRDDFDHGSKVKSIVCKVCGERIDVGNISEKEKIIVARQHLTDIHGFTGSSVVGKIRN